MRNLIVLCVLTPSFALSQSASPQTARQALLEMFFGQSQNHFEKHLPDATRRALSRLSSPEGQSYLAEFSMLAVSAKAAGNEFQTFDTGSILLVTQDPRGPEMGKVEITVERDDLVGDEDQIELGVHLSKNGKEEALPVLPRFTFAMKEEADVWRLNEISVTVRVPLADPEFLKTIENQQRTRNEQMTMFSVQEVVSAEKDYNNAEGHYACSLAALTNKAANRPGPYLWDAQLAKGTKNGYVFAISNCDSSHYKIVAEPAVPDSGERAFCSDEGGQVRAASNGKAASCLSNGDVVLKAPAATGAGVILGGKVGDRPTPSPASPQILSIQGDAVSAPARVRVSSGVAQGRKLSDVAPIYPPMARVARVQGPVVMAVVIGLDGSVQNLHVLSTASPLLNQAAIDAVRQWKYKPYLLNGKATEVDTTVTVNFTLTQ